MATWSPTRQCIVHRVFSQLASPLVNLLPVCSSTHGPRPLWCLSSHSYYLRDGCGNDPAIHLFLLCIHRSCNHVLSHSLAICSSTPCIHRSRFPIYTALPTVMRVGNHIERLTTELHSDPTSTFPICCMFAARFSTTSSQSQEDGCGCTSATTMLQSCRLVRGADCRWW